MCFYETILENYKRKPYFDLDIENKGDMEEDEAVEIVEELKKGILKLVPDAVITVYTSHTSKKFSFHILVINKMLSNHSESRVFYEKATEGMNPCYLKYIDSKVYSKIQQFRIVGCHKWGKQNTKVICQRLCHNYTVPKRFKKKPFVYHFISSLVTVTADCEVLTGFQPPEKPKYDYRTAEYDEEDLEKALGIFFTEEMKETYRFMEMIDHNGSMVMSLQRLKPSECQICDRCHDHENPFLIIGGDRNIYFDCRRRKEGVGMKYVGRLDNYEDEMEDMLKSISTRIDYNSIKDRLDKIKGRKSSSTRSSITSSKTTSGDDRDSKTSSSSSSSSETEDEEKVVLKVKDSSPKFFDMLNKSK
jgi:hypothetical protein